MVFTQKGGLLPVFQSKTTFECRPSQARPDGEPVCVQDRDEKELPACARDRLPGSHRPGWVLEYSEFLRNNFFFRCHSIYQDVVNFLRIENTALFFQTSLKNFICPINFLFLQQCFAHYSFLFNRRYSINASACLFLSFRLPVFLFLCICLFSSFLCISLSFYVSVFSFSFILCKVISLTMCFSFFPSMCLLIFYNLTAFFLLFSKSLIVTLLLYVFCIVSVYLSHFLGPTSLYIFIGTLFSLFRSISTDHSLS